jgi:ribose 5-phosphate isomerase A
MLAEREGIPLTDFSHVKRLDVTVDGADEVDKNLNLIKGGGGALLREKIVAAATDCFIIVIDSRKSVLHLGAFPLPVEVVAFGWQNIASAIAKMGADVKIRLRADQKPFLTNQGNYILDCDFHQIPDPVALGIKLRSLIGVVEHGLFVGLTDVVIVGRGENSEIITAGNSD